MNILTRRARNRLLGALVLLALTACRTSPPDNSTPSFNASESSPTSNLEATVDAGALFNAYDFFNGATAEAINTNPDNLQTVTIDTSGATGLLTLEPVSTQTPGIYELGITATNDTDTSKPAITVSNLFVVNVLPAGQPDNPTVVDFAMSGLTTQTASITLFATRNGITNGSTQNLQLLLPDGANPSTEGVTVNSITPVVSGTDTAAIQVNLTVNSTTLATYATSATDNLGNSYTNGLLLEFVATPPANGYTLTPYTEMVYLRPD